MISEIKPTVFINNNILFFIVDYFKLGSNLKGIDFANSYSLNSLDIELTRLGFSTMITQNVDINGIGFCVINISFKKENSMLVFCVYNTELDYIKYYDVTNQISYYSSRDVFDLISYNGECLLICNL